MQIMSCKTLALIALLTFGGSVNASVQMCGESYDPDNSWKNTWDESINKGNVCKIASSFESELRSHYGFRNFSGSACDPHSEKGRMMNALWVLKNAAPGNHSFNSTPNNSGFLMWAYKWAGQQTSILETTCKSYTHFQKVKRYPSFRNTYYMRFDGDWLFNGNLVERAGVIVHEARHRQVGHSSNSSCSRGRSCDTHYLGANEYQRRWLEWFAVDSNAYFTDDMAQRAGDAANAIAATAFSSPRTPLTIDRSTPLVNTSINSISTARPKVYVGYTEKVCEFNDPLTRTTSGCTQIGVGGYGGTRAFSVKKNGSHLLYIEKNTSSNGSCSIKISGSANGYSIAGNCINYRVYKL
jgi:hypothetical protein